MRASPMMGNGTFATIMHVCWCDKAYKVPLKNSANQKVYQSNAEARKRLNPKDKLEPQPYDANSMPGGPSIFHEAMVVTLHTFDTLGQGDEYALVGTLS